MTYTIELTEEEVALFFTATSIGASLVKDTDMQDELRQLSANVMAQAVRQAMEKDEGGIQ